MERGYSSNRCFDAEREKQIDTSKDFGFGLNLGVPNFEARIHFLSNSVGWVNQADLRQIAQRGAIDSALLREPAFRLA